MASHGFISGDEDNAMELLVKWPLEYLSETREYVCGWCGQVLLKNNSLEDLEAHFKSCPNGNKSGFLMTFKELRKLNQKFEALKSELSEMKKKAEDNTKTTVKEENEKRTTKILNLKTELKKEIMQEMKTEVTREILAIKLEVTKDMETKLEKVENIMGQLKKSGEMREKAISTLFNKINVLEEKMNEKLRKMDAAQRLKMDQVQNRLDGATEVISNVVFSIEELKAKNAEGQAAIASLSKQLAQTKKESDIAHSKKTQTQSVSPQLKNSSDVTLQKLETQCKFNCVENERKKVIAKKNSLPVEPSQYLQLALPMNPFHLVAYNYLYQPSYRWTIDGIEAKLSRGTCEVSSEMFQWNGYPVQCRAKLRVKADDSMYVSLEFKDDTLEISSPILPQMYYLLRNANGRNPRHKCLHTYNFFRFNYATSKNHETCLAHKSWLDNAPPHDVNDAVEMEIYVEPSAMTQLVHSYAGSVQWTMENYRKRLELEEGGFVTHQDSPYFYTSPNGYRVQVELRLRGGPAALVVFMPGKFDAHLPSSFPHRTTLMLKNPQYPERSIVKMVDQDIKNLPFYEINICTLEELERQLCINDTLLCSVTIESRLENI